MILLMAGSAESRIRMEHNQQHADFVVEKPTQRGTRQFYAINSRLHTPYTKYVTNWMSIIYLKYFNSEVHTHFHIFKEAWFTYRHLASAWGCGSFLFLPDDVPGDAGVATADAAEDNFLPLEDNDMEVDHEIEEHTDRQQVRIQLDFNSDILHFKLYVSESKMYVLYTFLKFRIPNIFVVFITGPIWRQND